MSRKHSSIRISNSRVIARVSVDQQQDPIIYNLLPKGTLGLHLISAHTAVSALRLKCHFILGSHPRVLQPCLSVSANPHVLNKGIKRRALPRFLDFRTEEDWFVCGCVKKKHICKPPCRIGWFSVCDIFVSGNLSYLYTSDAKDRESWRVGQEFDCNTTQANQKKTSECSARRIP